MNSSICVVGSINMDMFVQVDRFPKEGETLTGSQFFTASGGKGANQAAAASRLGATTAMIGAVGVDEFGKTLIKGLREEKIATEGIKFSASTPTGTAVITVNSKAQNQIIVIPGANHAFSFDHIKKSWESLSNKPQAVLLQLEIPLTNVIETAKLAKEENVLVVLNPAPAKELPEELLSYCDYLIPNQHESYLITSESDHKKAAQKLLELGVKNAVITLGEKGVYFLNSKEEYFVPSYKVAAIDPTAAGDTFVAAFTVGLLEKKTVEDSLKFASAAAGLSTTKTGALPSLPLRKDVEDFISNYPNS